MAIEAKYDFLRRTEAKLASEITAADLTKVMAALSDMLESFDMMNIDKEPENDDLLSSFLTAMQIQGRSQKTIDRYKYVITRMMNHAKVSTRRISVYHLRAFLAAEKERGLMDSSLESNREVFSAYFSWLQREGLIERNPAANLGRIRVPKKQRQICSDVDIEKLMRSCECKRDMAIIAFLASTGCRISEVVELNRDQVDLERLQCIVHGKGDKERIVYLDSVAGMLLQEYLSERRDSEPELFHSKKGNRLAAGSIRFMLNSVAARAGVEHVHPHKFRRTLATNLNRRGMPIQNISKILGHEKIDTTMRYVNMDDDNVRVEYRRYA